jgi:O-antigen/teichoic acid export membrane protein
MSTEAQVQNLDRSLARAVAWNAAARWISQILSWISTIVIARLLTPYDYGIVGMASLYLNLAMYVSQAGIGDAIIALRDLTRRQIAELNALALIVGAGLVGLSCVLAQPIAHFFSSPALTNVLMVSSLIFAFSAFQVVPRALLQKELRFKLLAGIETVRTFFQIFAAVLFALLHFRYWSLVIGYVVASATTSAVTLYWKRHEFRLPRFDQMRRELRYSRQIILSRVAWYSYENADFGVAGRVLGSVPLGNYTVAWNISSAPLEKIANLVTGVTPAYFSAVQTDKSELRRYLLRLTEILSLVAVPASIGLALVADYVVKGLLGPRWVGVIGPLRLLGLFVATRSLATFLPNLLTAIGDSAFVMWAMVGSAVTMPIAFLVGSHWGTSGIATAWLVAYPIVIAPVYYRVFQKTEMPTGEYVRVLVPSLTASAIMVIAVWGTRAILPVQTPAVLSLCATALVGAVAYCGGLLLLHRGRVGQIVRAARGALN